MTRLIQLVIILGLGWLAYTRYHAETLRHAAIAGEASVSATDQDGAVGTTRSAIMPPDSFSCDGRTYCSEMRSCEEATFFLQHCPNTKMDGDRDGVPCERQWCATDAR
jgi:hypothetical protein